MYTRSKWVNKNYTSIKSLNPSLPLAVRGVKGTPAVINVQYGKKRIVLLMGLNNTTCFL